MGSNERRQGALRALPAAVLLAGCSPPGARRGDAGDPTAACRRLLEEVDREARRAGVREAADAEVRRFPYLRADRFLEASKGDVARPAAR